MRKEEYEISVVTPVYNEEGNLEELHNRLTDELNKLNVNFELIYVNDGSTDKSLENIKKITNNKKDYKYISFRRNYGKGAAYKAGFKAAQGEIIVTIDSDLQDDPAEIGNLLSKINKDNDLVVGWKKNRKDPIIIVFISYLSNLLSSALMGKRLHDLNCGLKAMKKEVSEEIEFSGDLFRMIPIMAYAKGFSVTETPVVHHERRSGKSKYGWKKVFGGSVDMLTALFLSKFATKPAHFFGILGGIMFAIGFTADLYVTLIKLNTGSTQGKIPLLIFGVLMLIVGVQLISVGFLAELIVSRMNKKEYYIQEQSL